MSVRGESFSTKSLLLGLDSVGRAHSLAGGRHIPVLQDNALKTSRWEEGDESKGDILITVVQADPPPVAVAPNERFLSKHQRAGHTLSGIRSCLRVGILAR